METIYSNNETININPTDDLVLYKEEFINSRIEKFLYAICALDFDDLPTPLSRIEELYKCLATGLPAPTFVPQSRVEKYLMAILGGYDTNALPAPQSRTEVLLNKILLGDTDLSDIEWLKSRYEFLLAYIAKSGETSSGPDVNYVNYSIDDALITLHDTIDYPVKNAVLRGQTLVNLIKDGYIPTSSAADPQSAIASIVPLDGSKEYTVILNKNLVQVNIRFWYTNGSFGNDYAISSRTESGYIKKKLEIGRANATGKTLENIQIYSVDANGKITNMMLLEGDYTNVDIPYFTGMKSVKMPVLTTTGKNLFDEEQTPTQESGIGDNVKKVILNENTTYTYSSSPYTGNVTFRFFDCYDAEINRQGGIRDKSSFVTPGGTLYAKIHTDKDSNIQIEEGLVATQYEPHKSNILTCNEEVTLRSIGDIKDELNLLTGELTQRVQERVFDGSENWIIGGTGDNYIMFRCENYTDMIKSSNVITCDRYAYNKLNNATSNLSVTNSTTTGKICIVTSQKDLSIDNFKAKLNTDKPTIQYQLAEPIVKTVDLSIVDQDDDISLISENGDYIITENGDYIKVGTKGGKTKLSTFDDVTHVMVSSEGLVPTGEIDIARPIQFVDYSLDNGLVTLYNTINRPVKNAVLRGQTLVNKSSLTGETTLKPGGVIFIENTGMKTNATYTIMFNCSNTPSTNFIEIRTMMDNTQITQAQQNVSAGYNKFTIKTHTSKETNRFRFKNDTTATTDFIFSELLILEGDYTNENIPYFEGMASVKMPVLTTTGKNLYPYGDSTINNPVPNVWYYTNGKGTSYGSSCKRTDGGNWFYLEKGVYNYKSINENAQTNIILIGEGEKLYDSGKEVPSGWYVFRIKSSKESVDYMRISQLQLEKDSTATSYEPHKSTTVSCNEEVELGSVGDVKDELNLLTRELTQRTGEIVLDGSEDWVLSAYVNSTSFYTPLNNLVHKVDYLNSMSCDKLVVHTDSGSLFDSTLPNGISAYADWTDAYPNENWIYIKYADSEGYVEKLKQWLSQNPITVQYELAAESVKTVDLSTLDQDGKETELSTFDDITHVIVSSEGLVPTGEITVATKNATDVIDASVMSLRMDDILNSQSTLEESANTQSDDIDATMLGATDIYEQLL